VMIKPIIKATIEVGSYTDEYTIYDALCRVTSIRAFVMHKENMPVTRITMAL